MLPVYDDNDNSDNTSTPNMSKNVLYLKSGLALDPHNCLGNTVPISIAHEGGLTIFSYDVNEIEHIGFEMFECCKERISITLRRFRNEGQLISFSWVMDNKHVRLTVIEHAPRYEH